MIIKNDYKIVFLGTPKFAVPFLSALAKTDFKPVLVVTQNDEPSGRKQIKQSPPVKVAADSLGLEVLQPKNQKELAEVLKNLKPDVCILVAFGEIIKKEILSIPKFGFVNIHPSLLPKYRGASPVQAAILNGDKKTGISIMVLDEQMDHGPIIAQKEMPVADSDNSEILHQKLAEAGSQLLLETLPKYFSGEITPVAQNHAKATFTKIITRQDGQINWQNSAIEIERQFRAFYPWPGVFTAWAGKRLKIVNLSVVEGNLEPKLPPGTIFLTQNQDLAVACGRGAVLLKTVQLEGKKETAGKDFARGYSKIINAVLS